jgi:16S rRNA C1402 (ribose-2'-O) methylase RsmI
MIRARTVFEGHFERKEKERKHIMEASHREDSKKLVGVESPKK